MTRWIPTCPRCYGDLDDEGLSFWCPACDVPIPLSDAQPPGVIDDDD